MSKPGGPPADSLQKQAAAETPASAAISGGQWPKGVSGNPKGRKRGSRNRATAIAARLLEGQASALVAKVVELALAGDVQALRVAMERLLPRARERPLSFELPHIEQATDLPVALAKVASMVAGGELTVTEGERVAGLLNRWRAACEVVELEQRLAALEAAVGERERRPRR